MYVYKFSQRPQSSFHEAWVGADHAHDLVYLWWNESDKYPFSAEEQKFAKALRAYWANFAVNG